nr:PREDICTED: reticulophagy receptor Fam134b-like [Bemisia tabaci]
MFESLVKYVPFLKKASASKHKQAQTYDKFESLVYACEYLLLWQDPYETKLVLLGINLSFWYLTLIHTTWRFYGLVFTVILGLYLGHVCKHRIWPEIKVPDPNDSSPDSEAWTRLDSNSENVEEIMHILEEAPSLMKDYCVRLKNLRRSHPGLFCLVLCSSFAVLSFLGQNIAGLTLLYFLIMLAFVPGFCLLYLPPHMTANAISFVKSFLKGSGGENDIDEFIPQISEADQTVLNKASINAEKSSRSLLSSLVGSGLSEQAFLPESSSMPSYDESSMDCLDSLTGSEFELSAAERARLINQLKDPGDSSDDESILLKNSQFSGDISSDSEEEKQFCRDLFFSEPVSSKSSANPLENMFSSVIGSAAHNLSVLSSSIISNTFSPKGSNYTQLVPEKKSRHLSSSDEDFEIIDEDDVS